MEIESVSGYRILVVDDYPDTVDVVCTLLEVLGHEAHGASSGLDAIEKLERFAPAIALIDLSMPGLDGIAVAERVRARYGAEPYLVALTGWDRPQDRVDAYRAGFDEFIVKPAVTDVLRRIIDLFSLHKADRKKPRSARPRPFTRVVPELTSAFGP